MLTLFSYNISPYAAKVLDGLDGWDLVQARPRVAHFLRALSEPAEHAPGAGDEQPRQALAPGSDSTPASRPPT